MCNVVAKYFCTNSLEPTIFTANKFVHSLWFLLSWICNISNIGNWIINSIILLNQYSKQTKKNFSFFNTITLFITDTYLYSFLVAKLFYNFHLIVLKLICQSLLYLKETVKILKKILLTNSKYVLTKPKMPHKKNSIDVIKEGKEKRKKENFYQKGLENDVIRNFSWDFWLFHLILSSNLLLF